MRIYAEPIKTAVITEIGARSKEKPQIIISADAYNPNTEAVAESELPKAGVIKTEEKTQKPEQTQKTQSQEPSTSSTEPRMGGVRIVNGEKQIYIDGFGWIKDEGGGSQEQWLVIQATNSQAIRLAR